MQKVLIGILAITTTSLGILCVVQSRQLRATNERLRAVEEAQIVESETRKAWSARVNELKRAQWLEQEAQEFASVTPLPDTGKAHQTRNQTQRTGDRQTLQNGSVTDDGPLPGKGTDGLFGKGMGQMLDKMMKDPAMREMMRGQQKVTLNMMYAGLFKELNLSSEEKEQLTSILLDAQMRDMESAQVMFGEKQNGTAEDAHKLFADAKQQTEADVKALLGDARFVQYEEYQKNLVERMQLDQLKTQMAAENLPLQDEQIAQLLQAMKEERAAVPPVMPTDNTQSPNKEMFLAENLEKQMQWMDDYKQRLLDRAESGVTPCAGSRVERFSARTSSMESTVTFAPRLIVWERFHSFVRKRFSAESRNHRKRPRSR